MNFRQQLIYLTFCVATVLISMFLSSCAANPYETFYTPVPNSFSVLVEREPSKNPTIVKGESIPPGAAENMVQILKKEIRIMRENGYQLIGYSNFMSSKPQLKMLRAHAKRIGADTAIFYKQYRHTERGHVPLTLSNARKKIKVQRSGTISGDVSAHYNEDEIITLPKTYTTHWLPYSHDRYSFCATFWTLKELGNKRYLRREQ